MQIHYFLKSALPRHSAEPPRYVGCWGILPSAGTHMPICFARLMKGILVFCPREMINLYACLDGFVLHLYSPAWWQPTHSFAHRGFHCLLDANSEISSINLWKIMWLERLGVEELDSKVEANFITPLWCIGVVTTLRIHFIAHCMIESRLSHPISIWFPFESSLELPTAFLELPVTRRRFPGRFPEGSRKIPEGSNSDRGEGCLFSKYCRNGFCHLCMLAGMDFVVCACL